MESGIKMSNKATSKEIINEMAEELASRNEESNGDIEDVKENEPQEKECVQTAVDELIASVKNLEIKSSKTDGWFERLKSKFKNRRNKKGSNSDSSSITFDDLRKKRGIQNLQERSKLLNILKWLFGIQLVFMNIVVALIVVWVVFKFKYFNDVDKDILSLVVSFVKSYIAVVLAELLGGIIYVTHKVFSEKFTDNLSK